MKEELNKWLAQKNDLPGVLATGLVHPDKSTFAQSFSPDFADVVFNQILSLLAETLQNYHQQKLPGARLRWSFERFLLHAALRHEGTGLLVLTPKTVPSEHLVSLENLCREFQTL